MTSGSEEQVEPVIQGVQAMTEEVRKYLGEGNPMLTGPCTVTLTVTYENPVTPALAVKMATTEIAENGFNVYTFTVEDDLTGDQFYVRNGEVYTRAEIEVQAEEIREQGGQD